MSGTARLNGPIDKFLGIRSTWSPGYRPQVTPLINFLPEWGHLAFSMCCRDLRTVVLVEVQYELRSGDLFDMRERPERHLASVRALNVELVDVLNVRARIPFS